MKYSGFTPLNLNTTSDGMLTKRIIRDSSNNSILYLDKTGELYKKRFSNIEPVVEVICYNIAKYLGLNCAEYKLLSMSFDSNTYWVKQDALICRSTWFLGSYDTMISFKDLLNTSCANTRLYYMFISKFDKFRKDIDNLILFDYLINNTDRHHRNLGIIKNECTGNIRFAPLFDHGSSLGADIDDDFLECVMDESCIDIDYDLEDNLYNVDISKLFCHSNKLQLDLIEYTGLLKDKRLKDILNILDEYKCYFSDYRFKFMCELLIDRFQYLKRRFE